MQRRRIAPPQRDGQFGAPAGAQTNTLLHRRNHHFSIGQLGGAKSIDNHFRDGLGFIIVDDHFDLDLDRIFDVFGAPVLLQSALPAACSFNFEDVYSRQPRFHQNFSDLVELERLDDRLDFFHRPSLESFNQGFAAGGF